MGTGQFDEPHGCGFPAKPGFVGLLNQNAKRQINESLVNLALQSSCRRDFQ
jgi:hypothetical protein